MKKNIHATILLLIGTVFWGMTFVFIKEAVSIINPYTFLGYRFISAGFLLCGVFYYKLRHLNLSTLKFGLWLAIPLSIGCITQTIGLQSTTASKSAFITGLSVVFVPVFLSLLNKQFPKLNHIVSVILATIGLALLTLAGSLTLNIGDFWTFMCAIAFAIYIIMVGKYAKYYDSILVTIVQLLILGFASIIISFAVGGFVIPTGYLVWQAIIFTSVFATAFMFVIQNHYQKFISEIKTVIIFSLEPLFAAITAYFYLHEKITVKIIIGGFLILAGMIVSEIKPRSIEK